MSRMIISCLSDHACYYGLVTICIHGYILLGGARGTLISLPPLKILRTCVKYKYENPSAVNSWGACPRPPLDFAL